jgi:hypothetical protein
VLRHASDPDEISDRIVTRRLESGETAAFVRLRIVNRGRSTARNVAVSLLKVHRWDPAARGWIRARPELDGRFLQPSNQVAGQPDLLDVFPHSDRIVDLASVDFDRVTQGASPIFVEITHPWPPNEANVLEPGAWRLELLLVGDNIRAARSLVAITFDGTWSDAESADIWQHFLVDGPVPELAQPAEDAARLLELDADHVAR